MCRHSRTLNRQRQLIAPFLTLTFAHCPKIVFGVLEVVLRHDTIPSQSFSAGKRQIAFIASMEVLNIICVPANKSARSRSLGGLRTSWHGSEVTFVLWRCRLANAAIPSPLGASRQGLAIFEIITPTASPQLRSSELKSCHGWRVPENRRAAHAGEFRGI